MEGIWKKPSAWVPVALSLGILSMEFYFLVLATAPAQPETDEGVAAHLFQLWLVAEFFLVAFFAASWLPREPKAAARILVIQVAAVLAGMFPVFYFQL